MALVDGIISGMPFITQTRDFKEKEGVITGKVQVSFDGLTKPLDFKVNISPQYPLKSHGSESIQFYNEELIKYNHVMENGSICIHTSHHIDLKQKLIIDFKSLKLWVEKYYINHDKDHNYEHIIVNESLIDGRYLSFAFTSTEYDFLKDQYGTVKLSPLNSGIYRGKSIDNFLVQNFVIGNQSINCKWSEQYKNKDQINEGLFYFLEDHPAKYNRFIFKQWDDLNGLLPSELLESISQYDFKGAKYLPLFLGYNTIEGEIHWQVAILEKENLPLEQKYVKEGIFDLPKWELVGNKINWAISRNSSYEYFFGRGALCNSITDSRILILGVGAIGSIVAKSLVRGGALNISLADYDVKEYENVCRSEYMFQFGAGDKVNELGKILTIISPFVDISIINDEYFE